MLVHARGRRHAALDALPQQGGAVTDRLHVVHRQVCQEEKEILGTWDVSGHQPSTAPIGSRVPLSVNTIDNPTITHLFST